MIDLTARLNDACKLAHTLLGEDDLLEVTLLMRPDDDDESLLTITAYRCESCGKRHVTVTAEGPSTTYGWEGGEINVRDHGDPHD